MKRCSTCTVKCFLSASPDPEKKASSMLAVAADSGIDVLSSPDFCFLF